MSTTSASTRTFEYLYVDANTGQSSGGHTAVKFQDTVFHFQFFPDKIFRIVRETWESFRYTYAVVENRNIVSFSIQVSQVNYEKVLQRFQHLYLAREKQIRQLEYFQTDVAILSTVLHPEKKYFSLPAAGYIVPKYASNRRLFPEINSKLCLSQLAKLKRQLQNFSFPEARIGKLSFAKDLYTNAFAKFSFSKKYLSLLYAYQFWSLLKQGMQLQKNSFFALSRKELSFQEKIRLKQVLSFWRSYIYSSLKKDKPNYRSLLVNLARILVIQKSLQENRLFFLNAFVEQQKSLPLPLRAALTKRQKAIRLNWNKQRLRFFSDKQIHSEIAYHALEDMANRNYQLRMSLANSRLPWVSQRKILPLRSGEVIILPHTNQSLLRRSITTSRSNLYKYRRYLQEKYHFDLIFKNCTTEIFHVFNESFRIGKNDKQMPLGFYINADSGLTFIPFYAAYEVEKKYKVVAKKEILSIRRMYLRWKSQKGKASQFLEKENFAPTSSIFRFSESKQAFLFFTDDSFWLRPGYGLINSMAGLGQFLYGLPKAPFDKGKTARYGLQTVLFSLPEIFFFNIRKGYFPHISKQEEDNLRKVMDNDL
ncbi:MAG: hypothetical protein AAF518_16485 [Spirochaetota bacterium]